MYLERRNVGVILRTLNVYIMTHMNLGLSTNLLCEFGPLSFGMKLKGINKRNISCPILISNHVIYCLVLI